MKKLNTSDGTAEEKSHLLHLYKERAHCDANSTTLAQTLTKDISTGFKGHHKYLFELLQNADDAALPEKPQMVSLHLVENKTEKYLIISHTGKHFDANDVEKIADNAQQLYHDKAYDQQKTGYKGIGFKAIFSISDCVYIFSKGYQFRFDKHHFAWQRAPAHQQYPWPIIPLWTEAKELPEITQSWIDPQQVSFIVAIKPEILVEQDLKYLIAHPEIILFLRHARVIRLSFQGQTVQFSLQSDPDLAFVDVLYQDDKIHSRWYKYHIKTKISEEMRVKLAKLNDHECPKRMKDAKTTQLTFAAKLDEHDRIIKTSKSRLYCYLPTAVDTNLPYLVNADFLLNPERTHLQDNAWNSYLFKLIGFYQLRWLAELNDYVRFRFQILTLLTAQLDRLTMAHYSSMFQAGFKCAIEKFAFIPSHQDATQLLKAPETVIDHTNFYQIMTEVTPPDGLINYALENIEKLPKSLGLTVIDKRILCQELLPKHANTHKTLTFQKRLFNFLKEKIDREGKSTWSYYYSTWSTLLKNADFVLTETETLQKPKNLYFTPSDRSFNPAVLPQEIIIDFVHPELQNDLHCHAVLHAIGVKPANSLQLLRDSILPLIRAEKIDAKNILSITLFIFTLFEAGQLEAEDYKGLSRLPVLTQNHQLLPATTSYLADLYQPTLPLEQASASTTKNIFVSAQYLTLSDEAKADEATVARWKTFFKEIGVQDDVQFYTHRYTISRGRQEKGSTFSNYLRHLYSKGMTTANIQEGHTLDHFLDCNIIQYVTHPDFAKVFWAKVIHDWETIKTHQQSAHCCYRTHGSQSYLIKISYLQYVVQNVKCLPASNGRLYSASEIYSPEFKLFASCLPVLTLTLTEEQMQYFAIGKTPSFNDCVLILKHLNEQHSQDIKQYAFLLKALLTLTLTPSQIRLLQKPKHTPYQLPAQNGELIPTTELHYFAINDSPIPSRSAYWLYQFEELSPDELKKISHYFNIPMINKIKLSCQQATEQLDVKDIIFQRLALIARADAGFQDQSERELFATLWIRLEPLIFYSTHRLGYDYGSGEFDALSACLVDNALYFKGKWSNVMTIGPFCEELRRYLKLTPKMTSQSLREILTMTDEEIPEWLDMHQCYQAPLLTRNQINNEIIQIKAAHPPTEQPEDIKALTAQFAATDATTDHDQTHARTMFAEVKQTEPIEVINAVQPKAAPLEKAVTVAQTSSSIATELAPSTTPWHRVEPNVIHPTQIRVQPAALRLHSMAQPSLKTPLNASSRMSAAASLDSQSDTFTLIDDEHTEADELKLNAQDKKAIGDWGEHFVYHYLRHHYQQKYPQAQFSNTVNGFKLTGNDHRNPKQPTPIELEIIWHNRNGESGEPQDFTLIKNGKQRVIEVKSTSSASKSRFFLSRQEYRTLQHHGNRYRFFRVFNAGKVHAHIEKIKDPAAKMQQGFLPILKMQIRF